jgi:hypothetical protein
MKAARAYFVGCAALIGYSIGYALPIYARLPKPFYDPLARRWVMAVALGPIPMGYLGQCLWGLGGAAVAAALAGASLARARRPPSQTTYGLFAAWTLTALAIVAGYFTWNNWP